MTSGTRKCSAGITSLRQQLAPLDASRRHVNDEPGRGIAQQGALYILRDLDDADPNRFFGSAGVHQLDAMGAGMCHRNRIGLNDANASRRWYRMKVIGCEPGVGVVDRFRNRDHVLDGCVRYGTTPFVFFHIGKLLEKIPDGKPSKVGGIRLASAVDQVTLPTRAVRAVLARNHWSRRRRVQLREPVDGAGAPIDLSIRVALCASRNTKQLAIVGFWRLAGTLRPRPVRIGWSRGGLRGLRQVRREQATC